ncbi:hypothetical protein BDF22DRAFT_745706 [Syncephalis plumigaleata]|nr:hypothetical protein BDF22DRAFT_745706 [Syncephalis plumigaleata]
MASRRISARRYRKLENEYCQAAAYGAFGLLCLIVVLFTLFFAPLILSRSSVSEPSIQFRGLQQSGDLVMREDGFTVRYNAILIVENARADIWFFNTITVTIMDHATKTLIAKSVLGNVQTEMYSKHVVLVPFNVNYTGPDNDPVVKRFSRICTQPRQPMSVSVLTVLEDRRQSGGNTSLSDVALLTCQQL